MDKKMELTLLYSHNLPITHGTQSGFQTDVVHLFNIYRFKHPFAKPRPLHFLPAEVAEEKKNGIHWVGYGQNCLSWKRRYREWYQVTFVLRLCTPIFDQLPCCARLTDMKLENKSKPIPTVLDLCSTTSAHGFDGNSTTQLVAQSKNVLQLRRMN